MNLYGSTRDYTMFDEHIDLNNGIVSMNENATKIMNLSSCFYNL